MAKNLNHIQRLLCPINAPNKALNMAFLLLPAIIHAYLFGTKGEEFESLNLEYVLKQILMCQFLLLGVFTATHEKNSDPLDSYILYKKNEHSGRE